MALISANSGLPVIDGDTLAHPDCQAFLARVREKPDDPLPALVFCDWLEERGHPAGASLRGAIGTSAFPPAATVLLYTATRISLGYGHAESLLRGPVIDGWAEWYRVITPGWDASPGYLSRLAGME